MEIPELHHPVLGRLQRSASGEWMAQVELVPGQSIPLAIVSGRQPMIPIDQILDLAADHLIWARGAELSCREWLIDRWWDVHNDYRAIDHEPPRLDRSELLTQLRVDTILFFDFGHAHWLVETGDMFPTLYLGLDFDAERMICHSDMIS